MEIERKFTAGAAESLPFSLDRYPHHEIEQGYLCTSPVVRVRREDDRYYMTYKGGGLMAREEYNLPLTEESYVHLRAKTDGNVITKKRFLIPVKDFGGVWADSPLTVELDVFGGVFAGLLLAEVEFSSVEEAESFPMLPWFREDVTRDVRYHNSFMSGVAPEKVRILDGGFSSAGESPASPGSAAGTPGRS